MPIKARLTEPVPLCSVQEWIFGSSFKPLSDRKAFLDADRPDTHYLSFSDYRLLAKQIAIGLQENGLRPGDRVLLYSGNNVFFPVVFLGVVMAGGIFTGANPTFTARELSYQLENSGASFLVAAHSSLDVALEAAKQVRMPTRKVFVFDTTVPESPKLENPPRGGTRHWTELIAGREKGLKFDWVTPKDTRTTLCCLNYSSGTTGIPKGVEITHYNFVANGVGVIKTARQSPDHSDYLKRAVGLCFLPMYHAYGQTYFVANLPHEGIPVYVMPQFDFIKMLQHIQKYRITMLTAVPPIVVALAKHPAARKFDISSLENIGSGAAPLAKEIARETEKLFDKEKDMTVIQGWGMTELTCTAISWDSTRVNKSGGIGEVNPNCQAKVMSLDGKTEITTPHTPGELWVTGPTVMRGYWRNPKATRETIETDRDGTRWLKTGDIAYFDKYEPGTIWFMVDRIKELIKVKGNQVAPAELEALLLERPDVADAGVVGVVIKGEEVPRAYIVKKPDVKVASEEEIVKWVEDRVTRHKRLQGGVKFVQEIPKNPSGKILRRQLRDLATGEVGDRKPAASKI